MLKDTGYKEKIQMVAPWLIQIVDVVKRDLKNEHLKMDREFCKKYFLGKNPQQISVEEMAGAYEKDITQGNVGLGEFIATRWLLKNTDLYGLFEERLKSIDPDFEKIEELTLEQSKPLVEQALGQFGALRTYIFSVFNSVVFPKEIYDKLLLLAKEESTQEKKEAEEIQITTTLESLQKRHAREMAATTDKFEKKISGLQKKYLNDMEALKKQVSQLQKKLSET